MAGTNHEKNSETSTWTKNSHTQRPL